MGLVWRASVDGEDELALEIAAASRMDAERVARVWFGGRDARVEEVRMAERAKAIRIEMHIPGCPARTGGRCPTLGSDDARPARSKATTDLYRAGYELTFHRAARNPGKA
jgi:hypothetical protein